MEGRSTQSVSVQLASSKDVIPSILLTNTLFKKYLIHGITSRLERLAAVVSRCV